MDPRMMQQMVLANMIKTRTPGQEPLTGYTEQDLYKLGMTPIGPANVEPAAPAMMPAHTPGAGPTLQQLKAMIKYPGAFKYPGGK